MLRTMRSNAKWVFYILAGSFILWLAIGQVMSILEPSANVVLKVNGREVPVAEYQQRLQAAYEQYRQQYGTAPLAREEERQIQDQVINQLTQEILLHQEYRRLGIGVTDEEVIEAARTSPPPEVTRDPQFQTNGQFDIAKWQQFLRAGADRAVLAQLEAIYRDRIPQIKLAQYLTADVYISDAKLWRIYRDQNDSATVAVLPVWPSALGDSVPVTDAELERYLRAHTDDFKQPAVAFVRFVALPRLPDAADSAAARARVARIRAELARGAKFEDVARRESGDTASGRQGGDLGWVKRTQANFDPQFMTAVRALAPGQLSSPVRTQFGYHLIRVDAARGDSVKLRHILVPLELQGPHLDAVEAGADSLERLAADQTDGALLDSAARRFHLPLSPLHKVVEGEWLELGRYRIPDVGVWAFEAHVGETSPVVEAKPAYYVFRLDSLVPEGVPPLAAVRDRVLAAVRAEKQKGLAQRRADSLAAQLRGTSNLVAAAAARGLTVQRFGPFTRLRPPSYLAQEPLLVGAAFGLRVGERSGAIAGEGGDFIVESLGRKLADSSAWLKQREAQRTQLVAAVRQARVQQYVDALRASAKIVDRRKDIYRRQAEAETAL
ncbi:MAG TPA: SurA N-terminal domain-containing protein [Gemmatimonadales bacterium]|jgi:peptidyl-prolyl cis-trans isomerase D|nr:SurA N-terminal domain-containing protein [Gemmatimonadales bacterium]